MLMVYSLVKDVRIGYTSPFLRVTIYLILVLFLKPVVGERPEDQERTRIPHGTSRQIGTAVYIVSSYIGHSCSPSAKPTFSSGTTELSIVASKSIKKGDEITVSYVDASQHEGESAEDARRRRRFELARGWRFKCECDRCLSEATEESTENDVIVEKDESKVERMVERLDNGPVSETKTSESLGPD
ncbi:hypothetical protein QCA50_000382 [Cerrena zonata]|uniref:Histone-lysine N-methyltransferase SET5 n=1 Tax=Cerrena zonata TaxID=2478898 RepID=A0AAW0GR74_9APHY